MTPHVSFFFVKLKHSVKFWVAGGFYSGNMSKGMEPIIWLIGKFLWFFPLGWRSLFYFSRFSRRYQTFLERNGRWPSYNTIGMNETPPPPHLTGCLYGSFSFPDLVFMSSCSYFFPFYLAAGLFYAKINACRVGGFFFCLVVAKWKERR